MKELKIVIAEDSEALRILLKRTLSSIENFTVVGTAEDGVEAVGLARELEPHVLVLDISMPGLDGLETARHLAAFEPRPAVVFCTAFDEHALSAFEAEAIDYLVKPVRAERLAAALDRVRTFAAGRGQAGTEGTRRKHLCARLRGSLRLIPIEDVHYLHAEEKYVIVHHARGEDLIEESLKSLEEEFGDRFVRIHRNCLVARHEIVELKRSPDGHVQAVLRHARQPLEVSRRCVAGLKETLQHL